MIAGFLQGAKRHAALYGVRITIVALGAASLIFTAAALGPTQFGVFALMLAFAQVSSALVSVGGPAFLLSELPARSARAETGLPTGATLRLTLLFPIALSTAVWLGSAGFAHALPAVPLTPTQLGLAAAYGFVLNFLGCVAVPLRLTHGAAYSMALRDGVAQCILLPIAFAQWMAHAQSAELTMAGLTAFTLLVAAAHVPRKGTFALQRTATPLTRTPLAFWGHSTLGATVGNIDVLLAGFFLPSASIGIYSLLKRIANFASLPQILSNWVVAAPASATHARADQLGLQHIARKGAALSFPASIAICLALALLSPLFPSLFHVPQTSWPHWAFFVLLLGNLTNVAFGSTFTIASQCGFAGWSLFARLLSTVLLATSIVGLHLSSGLSLASLALLVLASTFIMNATVWALLRARLGVDCSAASLLSPSGAAENASQRQALT